MFFDENLNVKRKISISFLGLFGQCFCNSWATLGNFLKCPSYLFQQFCLLISSKKHEAFVCNEVVLSYGDIKSSLCLILFLIWRVDKVFVFVNIFQHRKISFLFFVFFSEKSRKIGEFPFLS